jgi:pimeloyl-ACP methyl ester carboxylesterase
VVVGSSIGGWIGAELALRDAAHRIIGLILINSVGVAIAGQPILNVSAMTPQELAAVSFHDTSSLPARPAPTPESLALLAGNSAALNAFAGDPAMHDPTLLGRLPAIRVPTLVVLGRVGRCRLGGLRARIRGRDARGSFETIPRAGHLPWVEQPTSTFDAIDTFTASLHQPSERTFSVQ